MANRPWPDGPTWEEIVRRTVKTTIEAECSSNSRRARVGLPPAPVWLAVAGDLSLLSAEAVGLCRACGYDPETGEKIEEER